MNIKPMLYFAALCAATLCPNHAVADPPERASIQGLDVDPGETEIEFQTRFLDRENGTEIAFQLQSEARLSKGFSIGGSFEAARDVGEGIVADTLLLQTKIFGPVSETSTFGAAIRLGAGYDFGEDRPLAEAALFVGASDKRWAVATRLGLEAVLGRSASPEIDYRARLTRELGGDVRLGIEAAGDIAADEAREHRIGPIIIFPLTDGTPSLEIALFRGLSAATANTEFRVELEFEF